MTLHPDFVKYFERMAAEFPPTGALTMEQMRQLHRDIASRITTDRPMVVRDLEIPADHPIPARFYRPENSERPALFLFIHGGGWIGGDLDTHDVLCREIAHGANCAVLAIDYRLAPENKFPAAFDDALAGARFALEKAGDLGCDATRVAIGGDSAGGNLTAASMIALRDAKGRLPCLQVLIYPLTDFRLNLPVYQSFSGPEPSPQQIALLAAQYLSGEADKTDWRASPVLADLKGLPPAFIMTAECDVLCDDGEQYTSELVKAGVPVSVRRYLGHPHGFLSMPLEVQSTAAGIADLCAALRQAFAQTS